MNKDDIFCLTKWGAVLKFNYTVTDTDFHLVSVSDPNCIDAGQYISGDEIVLLIKYK